jgi:tRNA pseudouridine55 synthase
MRVLSKQSVMAFKDKTEDNIILIDKPAGWSSFDAVKKVKGIGKFKKVGHAGTLDPFATGLMILGTGKATRSLTAISAENKSYLATIVFGCATDTFDVTGRITDRKNLECVDIEKIKCAITKFLGSGEQVPPMYSAKKVAGVRLYTLARKGVVVQRKPVPVYFHDIQIMAHTDLEIIVSITCSKGTYIRSFVNDLGNVTGYLAYLKALRRLSVCQYNVEHALSIREFESYWRAAQ